MIQTTRRSLGLILSVVFLSSCASPVNFQDVPVGTVPAGTLAQAERSVPAGTPSVADTQPSVGTPTAESVITSGVPSPVEAATAAAAAIPSACELDPVSQPPWPTDSPLPNEMDPETGLHMTGIPQRIELETYRLKVTGLVDHPLSLGYDELRCMPKVTDNPVLECPGVFTDYATWTGVSINHILDLAGVQPAAKALTQVSADGYKVNLPIETARAEGNFLAYEVDGKTLPVLHGFPLRAVLPSMWGSYWLKWLVEIKIS